MPLLSALFYFLAFVTIISAILVITAKNPVYSVLYLILTFFSITGHYILLNAQFVGIVNIIVYAGAIMVLFLFVVMLLNLNFIQQEQRKASLTKVAGATLGGLLLVLIVASIKATDPSAQLMLTHTGIGLIENLGKELFTKFLLPFELVAILILSATIGAVLLARKEQSKSL